MKLFLERMFEAMKYISQDSQCTDKDLKAVIF